MRTKKGGGWPFGFGSKSESTDKKKAGDYCNYDSNCNTGLSCKKLPGNPGEYRTCQALSSTHVQGRLLNPSSGGKSKNSTPLKRVGKKVFNGVERVIYEESIACDRQPRGGRYIRKNGSFVSI